MPKKTKEIENKIENIRNLLSKKNETKSKDDKSTKKATTSKSNKKDTPGLSFLKIVLASSLTL